MRYGVSTRPALTPCLSGISCCRSNMRTLGYLLLAVGQASWPAASLAGQEACPTCVNQLGATPLHDAAWSGNRELAAYLIEHGANVQARHAEGGSTPLAFAVIKNDLAMVDLLLAHGADFKAADNYGATPLHLAADRGYRKLVDLLLEKG